MTIQVCLNHVTEYRYDRAVTLLPHVVRLRPAPHCRTPILGYSLRVEPGKHFLNWQQDPFNNHLARLVFPDPASVLRVEVDLVAELRTINPFDFFIESSAERYPFTYCPILARELIPYLEAEPLGAGLKTLVAEVRQEGMRTVDLLVAINQRLQEKIRYVIRMEPGIQSCEETLTKRSGSCRDSAWVLVQVLRHMGLAARFVSGYLIQLTPDEKPLDGPPGPETDFTDLHAWAEVYLPGAGWVGLDPTSGLLAGEGHIPLACGADPITAAPITGSFQFERGPGEDEEAKCETDFRFQMSVVRVKETARVTKPYTEEEWDLIDDLGRRVDEKLQELDVRLTQGGEPTFVSIDDRDGAEWNTAAMGPHKRALAGTLVRRLRDRFAPGGFLHFGQGKWYPGESLPRWMLGCYWRRDGVPLWHSSDLVADDRLDYKHGPVQAEQFVKSLAERLGVFPEFCIPGYEDVWHYLLRERQLPANVDPLRSNLADPEERLRLARVFERGLGTVVGYVLPLRRRHDGPAPCWESGRWFLRREHLFLIPGDSPMGYRLPLDSLPWEVPGERQEIHERDPFAPRSPLRSGPSEVRMQHVGQVSNLPRSGENGPYSGQDSNGSWPVENRPHNGDAAGFRFATPAAGPVESFSPIVRTALCVEPRAGTLYIFMPPTGPLEDYLDLVAAIEATAAELKMPVLVEGYPPPGDHRLNHLSVTPDPGVIEVNVHPAHNWAELSANTTALYAEARQSRLCPEKFMLDGRHAGTGGGNHVVLGGYTPADSPFLRRPDLLRSLLGYWHNHPCLSYLFSGLFVGPTSQAPRVDEARNDSVYELELAFRQIPEHAQVPPWLVDRVFRHLLVDVTGNTHRAEFCIDKLYAPEHSSGRRGLLEMRAFEMPPHARMSLTQQLLLRSLIAWFWEKPYTRSVARWGTELHDRFMLPHFVAEDLRDVMGDLREAGFPLRSEWFAPHFEFRFPVLGTLATRGLVLELRQAIEPWHVLGEEPGGAATVRFVDSSVERVQVRVRGFTGERHVLACNRRQVPLYPTGTNAEYVAGVRFRAWRPPSCLHPTIPVHAPLVFDLVDTWTGRAVGGCTYHVAHPGGRAYDRLPVNANEAEARRASRFHAFGHSPGDITLPTPETHPEAPLTLDLRWPVETLATGTPSGNQGPPNGEVTRRAAVLSNH
jgi:uncharacterized protein (DUF2126 family)/transglutaminase-like putative cysteine protease